MIFIVHVILLIVSIFTFLKIKDNRRFFSVAIIAFSFLGMIFSTVKIIDPGEVGVVTTFGNVSPTPLENGIHFINPFSDIEYMDVRTQTYTMSNVHSEGEVNGADAITVLSSDALEIALEISVQYRLLASSAPNMYLTVGHDYVEKIVRPDIRSVIRNVSVNYSSSDLYSAKREQLMNKMSEELSKAFKVRGIVLENFLLRNVELPAQVKNAIEEKVKMSQEAQKMEFVLQKERQEAERKRVEAEGIADFQRIVSQGISEQLLKWKGIEATLELAKSQNAKVVVTGGAGLPLILGGNN